MKRIRKLDLVVHKFPETSGDWVAVASRKRRLRWRLVDEYRYRWWLSTTEDEKQFEITFWAQRWAGIVRGLR